MVMVSQVKAEDNKTVVKVPNDEWPSQVIFDTVSICYQGTLRWVAMGNPNLLNFPPPYPIARVMTVHCFCVLDKLRTEYKITTWAEMLGVDDPLVPKVAPEEFWLKAISCIKEHNTLQGLVTLQSAEEGLKILEKQRDNETITRKQKEETDNGSGQSDSTPEQPEELLQDTPQINF